MIQQSYIWEQFSDYIYCVPFCSNFVSIHVGFLKMTGNIYALKKMMSKVQMFMFGLTCFKARKAKTIFFLNILGNISGFMWLHTG